VARDELSVLLPSLLLWLLLESCDLLSVDAVAVDDVTSNNWKLFLARDLPTWLDVVLVEKDEVSGQDREDLACSVTRRTASSTSSSLDFPLTAAAAVGEGATRTGVGETCGDECGMVSAVCGGGGSLAT
jgi:hypothetical protein